MNIHKKLAENIAAIERLLPLKNSFDLIGRSFDVGDTPAYLLFVDGFAKDDIMVHVLKELQGTKPEIPKTAPELLLKRISYIETSQTDDLIHGIDMVLCGQIFLLIDGAQQGILIDAREYPVRSPSESHIEKVTRGPRDDLVETIVFNTALIRRRIRDRALAFEMHTVGSSSKTDVAIGYIGSLVDSHLLDLVRSRVKNMDVPALTMGEKSLEELLMKKKWYNPLPRFRFSERPDTIAAHLLEGHIILLVDTSPTALILPTSVFYFTQYIEDYYQNPLVGTITRFLRFGATLVATFAVPLYLLLCMYGKPSWLSFLIPPPDQTGSLPLFIQLILLELGLEGLKMSSLHTPQNLEAAFSIIGGLILGDFAVTIGVLCTQSIFLSVSSAVANHCVPNPEMGGAVRIFRWLLLILSGLLGIWGFAVGCAALLTLLLTTRTFDGRMRYLWPLLPFNAKALAHLLFRYPAASVHDRRRNK